jgi:hypothetical protein
MIIKPLSLILKIFDSFANIKDLHQQQETYGSRSVTTKRGNKTDRHDVTEIFLKVAVNTIT